MAPTVQTPDAGRFSDLSALFINCTLKPGDQTPSEAELVETFKVSRMTANRALREPPAAFAPAAMAIASTRVDLPVPLRPTSAAVSQSPISP